MDRNFDCMKEVLPWVLSLSARRAWIEIAPKQNATEQREASLSARRAWIEILLFTAVFLFAGVALRKESVDRNILQRLNL